MSQGILDGPKERNPATYARLKQIACSVLFSKLHKFRAVSCNQLLVGGANALSPLKGTFFKRKRRLNAAHRLAYHIYLRVVQNNIDVMNNLCLVSVTGEVAKIKDVLEFNLLPCALCKFQSVGIKNLNNSASHCTVSQYCYFCHVCLLIRSMSHFFL